VQQLTAHAVVRRGDAVGLVPAVEPGAPDGVPGWWSLPGGGIRHGEHPRAAVVRALADGTGVPVVVRGLRAVDSDVVARPERGESLHALRIVYDVEPVDGRAADGLRLLRLDELAGGLLLPFVARVLAAPPPDPGVQRETDPAETDPVETDPLATDPLGSAVPHQEPDGGGEAARSRRVGAYAVVVDGGRILLTRLVGSGRWTLPGGGIDHGEEPRDAVRREVYEETGLELVGADLRDVDSLHFVGHAPDGRLENFQAVCVVYTGAVGPGEPRVVEVEGSTDAAAWVPLDDLPRMHLSRLVGGATAHLQ
jgi:8-oxo-dGTP diphosphatase